MFNLLKHNIRKGLHICGPRSDQGNEQLSPQPKSGN